MAQRPSPRRREKHRRARHWHALPHAERAGAAPHVQALMEVQLLIVGRVVMPDDPDYEQDRQEFNEAFQAMPAAIVYCEVENDVRLCMQAARQAGLPIVVRSGGHSTAGYSVIDNAIVVDMSAFDCIEIDEVAQQVSAGPGVDFDKLNGSLNQTTLHVPSGACGNVCVGGFVQGGGYGYTSRMFGIQCDSVVAMRVMLADGTVVVADQNNYADLLWAMCGGTGNNFGVLLQVTWQAQQVPSVWAWAVQWDAADAAAVLVELQANYMRTGAAPQLGMMVNLGFHDGQQVLLAQGMYVGSADDGMQAIASLLQFPSAQLLSSLTGPYGEMDVFLDSNPYAIPNPPDGAKEGKRSGYIAQPLAQSDWQSIVDYMATAPNPDCLMVIEVYGGAINSFPAGGNAFVHRDCDMNVFIDVFWVDDGDQPPLLQWMQGFMNLIAPFQNGEVYQNYPYRDLPDYAQAYWGSALPTLQAVKAKYDPGDFFNFPQSVPLAPVAGR